jgi:hypothetical protein
MKLTDTSQQLSISDASLGAFIIQTGHQLTEGFKAGDTDKSGSISKEELTKGLVKIAGKSEDEAKAEAEKVSSPDSRRHAQLALTWRAINAFTQP